MTDSEPPPHTPKAPLSRRTFMLSTAASAAVPLAGGCSAPPLAQAATAAPVGL